LPSYEPTNLSCCGAGFQSDGSPV